MGMYDTINGEQVKCFPWVSLYQNEINYHGGNLKYYGIGDEVPYRKPHYNYSKNFIILDLNKYPESNCCAYDYILHVIVDGKVQNTFTDVIGEIDWSINNFVVSYTGELLNIHNPEDVINYIREQREYWSKCEEVYNQWNELFKEALDYARGLGSLKKDSEERKFRYTKIEEIRKLMDKEKEKIEPIIQIITEQFSKWYTDTSNIDDLIQLGNYISAYYTEQKIGKEETKICYDMIHKLLTEDATLYDRYIKWQGTEEDIQKFKQQ